MADRESGPNFAAWFLAGAVVGAAIGFLYAPRPGRETRTLLQQKAEEGVHKARETAEKAKEAATQAEHTVEQKLRRKKPQG